MPEGHNNNNAALQIDTVTFESMNTNRINLLKQIIVMIKSPAK